MRALAAIVVLAITVGEVAAHKKIIRSNFKNVERVVLASGEIRSNFENVERAPGSTKSETPPASGSTMPPTPPGLHMNAYADAGEPDDACVPALAQVKSSKCNDRGYLVQYEGEETYCGKCDWPYYGHSCQRARPDKTKVDVAVVVLEDLSQDLSTQLETYVGDLGKQGVVAEVFVWDLPIDKNYGGHRELRRLLKGEWKTREIRAAFLVGAVPVVGCDAVKKNTFPTLSYYMFFDEEWLKSTDACSTPGGNFVYPRFKKKKEMNIAVGILNHLTVDEYKFYFDKLYRWQQDGGNRFFDVGPGTGNKPLLRFRDIGNTAKAQPSNSKFSIGSAFEFPRDLDHYRAGEKCKKYVPAKNCPTYEGCVYDLEGQAFWPGQAGSKPSVVESDDVNGTKYVIVRYSSHGNTWGSACFKNKEIKGQPFAGGSLFIPHSCKSNRYPVPNPSATMMTLKYSLNSLGTAPNGAATDPWLYIEYLRQGKDSGEALLLWWKKRGNKADLFGNAGIVLYGAPTVKYGALTSWENWRPKNDGANAEEFTEDPTAEEEEQAREDFSEWVDEDMTEEEQEEQERENMRDWGEADR